MVTSVTVTRLGSLFSVMISVPFLSTSNLNFAVKSPFVSYVMRTSSSVATFLKVTFTGASTFTFWNDINQSVLGNDITCSEMVGLPAGATCAEQIPHIATNISVATSCFIINASINI